MSTRLRLTRALVVSTALVTSACGRAPEPAQSAISIQIAPDVQAPSIVRVDGLSATELAALREARLAEPAWQALFAVRVAGPDLPPIVGRYTVTATAVEFHPQFPFDRGRSYSARFDPSKLPTPRSGTPVELAIALPAPTLVPSTTVTTIFPSGAVWPENLLRFYVHFSAPMSRTGGIKFIHLLDAAGKEVPDTLLAAYADLWNDDFTRLTVLLDPGRVKRGVGPNVKLGRALLSGQSYALAIDAAWPDAQGQPLEAPYRRPFRAGPSEYLALSTSDWRIAPVRAGTRDPLVVSFPRPLDHALLARTIGVVSGDEVVQGDVAIGSEELSWTFAPQSVWNKQAHHLVVLTTLEDPVGNRIGRAFEVLLDAPPPPPVPDAVRVPFDVK